MLLADLYLARWRLKEANSSVLEPQAPPQITVRMVPYSQPMKLNNLHRCLAKSKAKLFHYIDSVIAELEVQISAATSTSTHTLPMLQTCS